MPKLKVPKLVKRKNDVVDIQVRKTRSYAVKMAVLKAKTADVLNGETLAKVALRRTKERFLRMRDPEQNKWQKLSPLTRKRFNAMGSSQILVDSLALYNSIDYRLDTFAVKKNVVGANGGGFRIVAGGSKAPYAKYHQFGGGRAPQRQFLGLSRQDVRVLRDSANRLIQGKAVKI